MQLLHVLRGNFSRQLLKHLLQHLVLKGILNTATLCVYPKAKKCLLYCFSPRPPFTTCDVSIATEIPLLLASSFHMHN